jgi:hypothetical protein
MSPSPSQDRLQNHFSVFLRLAVAMMPFTFIAALNAQQDYTLPNVPYVCNGERLVIENCNIRDQSDTSTCMVGHPDHVMPNGLMQYTTMTRAAIKQLFPTCKQPTPDQVARAQAFQKRQQNAYEANVKKANDENDAIEARAQAAMTGRKPLTPEERTINRCITSGRLPASCTGNALLGAFGQMLSAVLPSAGAQEAQAGPTMAGVFQGSGGWRLDFIDGGVLVNCSSLSPNQEAYTVNFSNGHATIKIDTTPRPLILTLHADNTITGPPGPITINGVVAGGYTAGTTTAGHTETSTTSSTQRINASQTTAYDASQLSNAGGGFYDATTTHTNSTYVPGTTTPGYTNFVPRRATCQGINLSTKGASTGIQTMQTDLLKGMFGGDKGPPTPAGVRMHGIYAASSGFSIQFFPESAILGCGPDAARAYPYAVTADGSQAVVKIGAPDHPLTLALKSDNTLDPGTGPYQVHGRTVTGQDNNDNFTFAPFEQTCNLALLTPAKAIPSTGALPTTSVASGASTSSLPGATVGNASLAIVSGFPAQPGTPNPLAAHPYTLLRDSLANIVAKAGVTLPAGESPYKALAIACGNRTPDCQKMTDGIKANAAAAVRADANGSGTINGVAPGTYYLMISTRYNNQGLVWSQPVQVKPGSNSITLDQRNATPVN